MKDPVKKTSSSSSKRTKASKDVVSPYLKAIVALAGLLPILSSLYGGVVTAPAQEVEDHLLLPTSLQNEKDVLLPSLQELTNTRNNHQEDEAACTDKSFVYIYDKVIGDSLPSDRRIPKIVHQTSKSRCLTKMFARISEPWRSLEGYDYYLHDDYAMMRLLSTPFDEFPQLQDLVQANCLPHGTLKADLWRYLVLWVYGGIYADIDTQPTSLFNTTLPIVAEQDDGWFVVEQFHILSQYVMAVSPRHPLMYYAVHHAMNKVLAQVDTRKVNAALVTGPHALHRALQDFCQDAGIRVDPQGVGYKPVQAGIWKGTHQRSITVVGRGEFEGEYITREMMSLPLKKKQYAKMNMTSFREDRSSSPSGRSCLSELFELYHQRRRNRYHSPEQQEQQDDFDDTTTMKS